jgi:hypothetical protein
MLDKVYGRRQDFFSGRGEVSFHGGSQNICLQIYV